MASCLLSENLDFNHHNDYKKKKKKKSLWTLKYICHHYALHYRDPSKLNCDLKSPKNQC
jgi:hypothetical protein